MFGGPPNPFPYRAPALARQPLPPPAPRPVPQPVRAKPRDVEFASPDAIGVVLDVTVPGPNELGIELK